MGQTIKNKFKFIEFHQLSSGKRNSIPCSPSHYRLISINKCLIKNPFVQTTHNQVKLDRNEEKPFNALQKQKKRRRNEQEAKMCSIRCNYASDLSDKKKTTHNNPK